MSPLDRDELAARLLVTLLAPTDTDEDPTTWHYDNLAHAAVKAADALLARLAPAPAPSLADAEWRDAPRAPAPYVPKMGDVLTVVGSRAFNSVWMGAVGVVVPGGLHPYALEVVRAPNHPKFRAEAKPSARRCSLNNPDVDVRLSTAAERVAAGLDAAPASKPVPVDREGLAKAIRKAWWGDVTPSPAWDGMRPHERDEWMSTADAAIAYMKGGAS